MRTRYCIDLIRSLLIAGWFCSFSAFAQESGTPIPADKIAGLKTALAGNKDESSAARKRLAVKRMIRDASELLAAHPSAPNRFEVLGTLFQAQRELIGMDNSTENREAFLNTCKLLAAAPIEYAAIRLDADLLLSQTEMARQGADAAGRAKALRPLVERYRGTPVEAKVLKVAMVMALEFGDSRLVSDLQEMISERFAGDLEMIEFQREKLGGQVIGAPFCGTFERADGKVTRFPMDGMGQSTALYFWSKEGDGMKHLAGLATAWKEKQDEIAGRLQIVSFNVDDLPDAGEGMLRGAGVDWPAMRLPGGRNNPYYRAFARTDPAIVTLSPTGYAALVMSGSSRRPSGETSEPDYSRWFSSSLARSWTEPRYVKQLASLFGGEFLVMDVGGALDPALPPELKALAAAEGNRLTRNAASVPEETLLAIQNCFVLPPIRYRMPTAELKANYEKAEALCAKAIQEHPQAPDLWIVRNRRIIALMGLWKLGTDLTFLDRAATEAKAALDAKPPAGTDGVARFCIAKESLHAAKADPKGVIGDFLTAMGGERAPGPALAAAAILALEVGDRGLHEQYRKTILARHTENPTMWTIVSFLLDRHHRYWVFEAPFTAGWSFGRRETYFLGRGDPEECHRVLQADLKTLDGKPFRIPQDVAGKWTAILFAGPGPEEPSQFQKKLTQGVKGVNTYAEKRASGDVQVVAAILDDDASRVGALVDEQTLGCPVVVVPGGLRNPLVQRLGILSEDERPNVVLIRPDGSIAVALSGLAMDGKQSGNVIQNVIEWHDEKAVTEALARGDIEAAKRLAFQFAPTEIPEPKDPKKAKKKPEPPSLAHLRSRARVYMALKDWDAALADAEGVVKTQTGTDAGMSLRTPELDEAEELRDTILRLRAQAEKSR
jgi:hypothetical protein